MAKKKPRHNAPKPAEFRTTPFSTLKGVAVAVKQQPAEPARPVPSPAKPVEDDAELFLRAMDDVKRLDRRASPPRAASQPQKPSHGQTGHPAGEPQVEIDTSDREAFAKAIGQLKLDVTFCDQTPEDEELKPLGANRLRQLKRGVVSVDRQLDLHGLTREEALDALPCFLESAVAHGERAVLVITGKGNNSPAEPVLQQAVAGWLRDAGKRLVVEFAPAPPEMGGSGAFVVFVRS
jgi:DNA-nicking Smr family endonuclease